MIWLVAAVIDFARRYRTRAATEVSECKSCDNGRASQYCRKQRDVRLGLDCLKGAP